MAGFDRVPLLSPLAVVRPLRIRCYSHDHTGREYHVYLSRVVLVALPFEVAVVVGLSRRCVAARDSEVADGQRHCTGSHEAAGEDSVQATTVLDVACA